MSGRRSAPQCAKHSTHNVSVVTTRLRQVLDIGMPHVTLENSKLTETNKEKNDGEESLTGSTAWDALGYEPEWALGRDNASQQRSLSYSSEILSQNGTEADFSRSRSRSASPHPPDPADEAGMAIIGARMVVEYLREGEGQVGDERIEAALERLEAALERLEELETVPPELSGDGDVDALVATLRAELASRRMPLQG